MKRHIALWMVLGLTLFALLAPNAYARHARGAATGAVTQQYKWNPGPFGLTYGQFIGAGFTYSGSYNQTDVASVIAAMPTIKGYTVFVSWAGLESSTQGNWQFQGCTPPAYTVCGTTYGLDNMLNALRSAGAKVILVIQPTGSFSGGTTAPTASGNIGVPAYITATANTGTYGSGQIGCGMSNPSGAGGFYANASGSWSGNLENAAEQTAFEGAIDQLATVFDGDPVLEGIVFTAMDFNYPCGTLTGLTGAPYYTAWENILTNAFAHFQHTSVGIQVAFDETNGDAQSENFTQWLVTNGGFPSASDTYGETAWTEYQEASYGCVGSGEGFASAPSGTSGTLAHTWVCATSPDTTASGSLYWPWQLSTGQVLSAAATNGSTAVTWTPSVTGSPTDIFDVSVAPFFVTQGMRAWMGISPNGSGYSLPTPALQTYNSSWPLIEAGDMCAGGAIPFVYGFPVNYNPADIIAAMNATGISGYKGSHPSFTILSSGQCTTNTNAVWSTLVSTLSGLTLTNTAYPYAH